MIKRRFSELDDTHEQESSFSLIADFDGNEEQLFEEEIDKCLPILPLRNMVLFPGVVLPVAIGRKSSLRLIDHAYKKGKTIGAVCQLRPEVERPGLEDLYPIGVVAKIVRVFEMPDQTTTVILQGMQRFQLLEVHDAPKENFLLGTVSQLQESFPEKGDMEFKVLVDTCKDLTVQFIKNADNIQAEAAFAIKNINSQMFLINFICANLPLSVEEKEQLLKEDSLQDRAYRLLGYLKREVKLAELKANIQMRTKEDLDQQQREYFLQQQMKNIQDELGGNPQDQDLAELQQRASKKKWNEEVRRAFERELSKLERTNPQSPDYNVQLNYLETLLSLPWNEYTTDNLNLSHAEKVLNKDHYGLEKVKERILEHLAVLKLRGDLKSPEIRGHRRTYIGAMPGRIIKNLMKAGSSNPVFILDEIDKVSQATVNGDPSSALLEVLDPEQNNAFHDNFLDIDYDLSKVMFIATANNLNTIPAPLLDRMELIEVSGYITEEKIEIARRHLIPKEMENVGMDKQHAVKLPKATIEAIIESYTRESGVRELEKKISKVFRKLVRSYATHGSYPMAEVKPANLKELLGAPEYTRDKYQGNDYAGVVTGLAWTAVGGEILFVETSVSRGKGGRLTLTGNLGDVMKESAMLALEYIKAHAPLLDIDPEVFENWNIHVHVPEGAIPKDGPSAGITMATSLASALTQRKVKSNLAMTGEITLRGRVLPVGGIKEKILAAKRAGIKEIILCSDNRKDIEEIPAIYLKGLTFHYVTDVKEVFRLALTDEKVADAIDFTITPAKKDE